MDASLHFKHWINILKYRHLGAATYVFWRGELHALFVSSTSSELPNLLRECVDSIEVYFPGNVRNFLKGFNCLTNGIIQKCG